MNRDKCFVIRLSQEEMEKLNKNVAKTTFSREGYIRLLLNGYIPVSLPPIEYRELIKELRAIGNNMHNIYYKACSQGFIDVPMYKENAERVLETCMHLERLRIPIKVGDFFGGNKHQTNKSKT